MRPCYTAASNRAPAKVEKQMRDGSSRIAIYPKNTVWFRLSRLTQDRVVLEIQRGCIRGCRFCQAGMLYRPTRERDLEMLKEARHRHAEKHRT